MVGTECVRVQLYQTRQGFRVIVASCVWPLEALYSAHMTMRTFVQNGATDTGEGLTLLG
jgi:hypothetical protein